MSNLLDSIKSYVTPEIVSQAAALLGENESGVGKAIGGLAPTILAGILNKSGDSNAMGNVFSMLSNNSNAGFLENLGGLVGGGNLAHDDPKDIAGSLMGTLFGGKVPAIINALSSFSGIKSSSTSTLLGMVGPLVMGVIGKKIKSDGLNVSGLLNLLGNEKSSILGALPGGMGAIMGLASGLGGGNTGGNIATPDVETASGNRWIWPLLLLAGLGAGIVYYMKNCAAKPELPKAEMPTMPTIDSAAIKAAEMAANAAGYMKKLASGFELKGNKEGIESKLVAFIEDASKPVDKTTWFDFDRLLFETGKSSIDMSKSSDQLTNMVEVLKAFPNVKLKIGGYTDNVGSEAGNMKLSAARAEAVVAYLVSKGIDKARLSGEGYGSQHPVASNDTEEGRAQNRRISVRVTAK
jgi:OmpA-OmpF porin, OOP family